MESRFAVASSLAVAICLLSSGCGERHDVVIRGGTIVDGTGAPASTGDVAIQGDRIVAVGRVSGTGGVTIDAEGMMVAPGFFDMHAHSEDARILDGRGPSFSLQGITTEIYGETQSMGPVGGKRNGPSLPGGAEPDWTTLGGFLESLERRGSATNFGSYVGSGSVRTIVLGYEARPPSPDELEQMRSLVRQAMAEGALGISSGMSYVPNIYMSTEELVALVREAGEAGGLYATHARTMNGTDPDAIREAVEIAEAASTPLHFFHLNSTSSTSAPEFLQIIEDARGRGLRVTGDSYTYTWGITGLVSYIPAWAQEGGADAMLERLRDPEQRSRIAQGFVSEPPYLANIGWDRVRLGVRDPDVNGRLVSEVAASQDRSPEDVFMDIVLEQVSSGNCQAFGCIVIDWNNEEWSLREMIKQPFVVGGTDGRPVDLESEALPPLVHPRHLGTFPRWLGTYVREEGLMTWEEAVHKLTGLPAETLGLGDRGTLSEGSFADIVVFDPDRIRGLATFEDPFHYSEGILHLFVNGAAVVADGEITGALPGRALRGPGWTGGE